MLRDVIRPLSPRRLRHWRRMRIDDAYRAKSAWTAEVERLRALPRYRSATTEMLGYRVEIPDAASFLEMYDEIFVREIFAFRSDHPAPPVSLRNAWASAADSKTWGATSRFSSSSPSLARMKALVV